MEPEDWVHVRVMIKVSNDIALVMEKKVVISETLRKNQDGNGKSLLLVAKALVIRVSTNMVQICTHDLIGNYKLMT